MPALPSTVQILERELGFISRPQGLRESYQGLRPRRALNTTLVFFPFQSVVTRCHLAHVAELCFSQEENPNVAHPRLTVDVILECRTGQLVTGLLLYMGIGLAAGCKSGLFPFLWFRAGFLDNHGEQAHGSESLTALVSVLSVGCVNRSPPWAKLHLV